MERLFVRTLTVTVFVVLLSGLLIGCTSPVCPSVSGEYCIDCGD